ncbi:MAG: vitamin B12-dependent ribonucleotide reductase [Patescibacteria group bacterium]
MAENETLFKENIPDLEPELSENALTVIEKRYLIKDENRKPIETPKQMFWRVAKHLAGGDKTYGATDAEIEKTAQKFYEAMAKLEFLPNSPTFTGAGTKLGQLSACFVLPVEDDMTEILKTQMNMGIIHKSGGGTGFSFSRLRPKDDVVGTTGGVSCGPIGFMQMFNDTTEQIKQGGTRRGANMGILRIDHPDIEEFITYKHKEGRLSNFNISVGITKKFWEALEKGEDYDLINPRSGKKMKSISAQMIFDIIIDGAWRNGEPGVIFLDLINANNPTPNLGEIEATNPCGEQPLLPYESCNLGSINLAKMVKKQGNKINVDWDKFARTLKTLYHFMDNVIDLNRLPIEEINEMTRKTRKVGMGIMGFADLLVQLSIPYNSEEGLALAEKIMSFMQTETHKLSQEYSKTRGLFPAYQGSIWEKAGVPMHNASTTTIAPTGTLSIMGSCGSGIEPFFALAYVKTVMDKDPLPEVNPWFIQVAKDRGFYSEELMKKVLEKGSIQEIEEIPEDVRKVFVISSDISADWHVKMQAAFQKYTDNGISKTINFPNSAAIEDVAASYKLAYKLKCKGLTVYRDGSRQEQILTVGNGVKEASAKKELQEKIEIKEQVVVTHKVVPRSRPTVLKGTTERVTTGLGKMYITINEDDQGPFEVFAGIGKSGGDATSMVEAIGRIISLALRSGVEVKTIAKHLKGIRGSSPVWQDGELILSAPDAIGRAIERYVERKNQLALDIPEKIDQPTQEQQAARDDSLPVESPEMAQLQGFEFAGAADSVETETKEKSNKKENGDICPECGGKLQYESGCVLCPSCAFSRCG